MLIAGATPSTTEEVFSTKNYSKVKGKNEYILDLWDTNGQEKYRAMTKLFVKNSKIVVFVYSTDNRYTFQTLNYWVDYAKGVLGDNFIIGIVGNKSDLYMKEEVKEIEGQNFADSVGAKFRLVSAKINPQGFVDFLSELLDEFLQKNGILVENNNKQFKVNNGKVIRKGNKCC